MKVILSVPKPVPLLITSGLLALWPLSLPAGPLDGVLSEIGKQLPNVLQPTKPGKQKPSQDAVPSGVSTAADAAGLFGLAMCAKNTSNKGNRRELCVIGAALAAEMTRQLGTKIADGLRESEQRQVLAAAAESLKTGEPRTVDLPESGTQVAVGPSGAEALREVKVELLVDQHDVAEVPQIHVVGHAQDSRGKLKMRNGPAAGAASVGTLKSGETVHVIGQVGSSVLVSRWVVVDGAPRPVGTGFVDASGLAPTAKKDFPSEAELVKSARPMKAVTVDAILKCRSLDFKKRDANGNSVEDKSYLCIGPDGSTRSA